MGKLLKKLKILESVNILDYQAMFTFYDYMKENDYPIIEFFHEEQSWNNRFDTDEKIKKYLSREINWATFRNCRLSTITYVDDNIIEVKLTIYTSEWIDSIRDKKVKVWELKTRLPHTLLEDKHITHKINYCFNNYLSNKYEEYLEETKEKWMKELADKLLN